MANAAKAETAAERNYRIAQLAVGDCVALLAFAAIGRGNHGEGMYATDVAATAAKERSVQTQRAHMGASASKVADAKPKKICCACPITKNARDACIPEHDEEKCKYLIDAHLRCLRDEGFDV